MDQSNVVLRYRDGRTERVSLVEIDSEREFAVVKRDDGAAGEVPFSLLKGIFFPHRSPDDSMVPATRSVRRNISRSGITE